MKNVIIVVTIFAIFGAVILYSHFTPSPVYYEKIADAITDKTANKLRNEKGLILVGTGGSMMDAVKMLMMGFDYFEAVDVKIARHLLINSIEEYLLEINNNEKIRPYLHNYPFTANNIEIEIYFRNPNGSKVALNQICIASARKGKIVYYIDDPDRHTLKAIFEETYEEATKR